MAKQFQALFGTMALFQPDYPYTRFVRLLGLAARLMVLERWQNTGLPDLLTPRPDIRRLSLMLIGWNSLFHQQTKGP